MPRMRSERWGSDLSASDVITHSKQMEKKLKPPLLLGPTPLRSPKWTRFSLYLLTIFTSLDI